MNEPRPFSTLSREVLVVNRWHEYCRDRYVRTDGTEGEYFHIDMPGAVGIIPRFADGSTLIGRQYRYLLRAWLWEFPIGGMEKGEEPLAAAKKELGEEAGLVAERWTYLGAFAPYKGVSTERTHFYLAEDLTDVGQSLEPEEEIELHRLPWDVARERLLSQELGDGQSWGGLLLLERAMGAGRA